VLQRYPGLENLEEIVNDFFYFTEFELDGETTDLYSLENDTIRPYAREVYLKRGAGRKLGRVHFALNCASASCPKLPNEAFDPARLDQQLERETRRFVSEARNVKVNKEARSVTLSMIFKWYAEDFVDDQGQAISPLAWINLYRDAGQQLDTSYEVKFSSYDWTLNDKTLQR
jgi:hypothetical protein